MEESSLTTPSDRTSTRENPWRPQTRAEPLTNPELDAALADLERKEFVSKYPKLERSYADPAIVNQTYALFSFVPAKDAKPNADGVYGFAKMRGAYGTAQEAEQRAEFIVRNVDSYHPIYHAFVGRPFPVCASSKYSMEVSEIDLKKEIADNISANVRSKKEDEQRTIRDIKERESALLAESKAVQAGTFVEDPYENYITLKVKKAQLTWTYIEHQRKMEEIEGILARTRVDIEKIDAEHPDFIDSYFQKYKDAREASGFKDSPDKDSFMKFMVDDVELPKVDAKYAALKTEEHK